MRKALLGFIVGVTVTSLAFVTFEGNFDDKAISDASPSAERNLRIAAPEGNATRSSVGTTNVERAGTGAAAEVLGPRESSASPESEITREARLRRQLDEARRAASEAANELEELTLARSLAAQPIVSPAPLPAEFDWVFEDTYRNFFHERFQREPIDAAWAASMEAQLLNFVYDRPELIQKYGVPTVRCHTTQCEVTFVGYGPGEEAESDARSLFDGINERLPDVFDCGPGECWADAYRENGVVTIFWGMTKKEQQLQGLLVELNERR